VTVVRVEKIVQRPPETVFDFVAAHHFQNHPRWDPDLLEMRQTSPGAVQVGTTAHVVRRQGGRRVDGTATVTEYEPTRSASWNVEFGALPAPPEGRTGTGAGRGRYPAAAVGRNERQRTYQVHRAASSWPVP
jgi:hypothetical protein